MLPKTAWAPNSVMAVMSAARPLFHRKRKSTSDLAMSQVPKGPMHRSKRFKKQRGRSVHYCEIPICFTTGRHNSCSLRMNSVVSAGDIGRVKVARSATQRADGENRSERSRQRPHCCNRRLLQQNLPEGDIERSPKGEGPAPVSKLSSAQSRKVDRLAKARLIEPILELLQQNLETQFAGAVAGRHALDL
jgi:hypothetical protein